MHQNIQYIYVYILLTKGDIGRVLFLRLYVHKIAKRERGQYSAILTELAWSIKDLLYGINSTEKMIFLFVYFHAEMETSYMLK